MDRASAAGLTVLAVTDHDTTAASAEIATHAAAAGIEAISGIEVTAVYDGRDVHVLGYFVSTTGAALQTLHPDARPSAQLALARALGRLGRHTGRVESLLGELAGCERRRLQRFVREWPHEPAARVASRLLVEQGPYR